jgi:tRNA(Ile)-lysidine synthase
MKGRKKLSDIFIDRKIPLRRRDETLVVADRNQILWLVGVTTAESARISVETENILKISVNPE